MLPQVEEELLAGEEPSYGRKEEGKYSTLRSIRSQQEFRSQGQGAADLIGFIVVLVKTL